MIKESSYKQHLKKNRVWNKSEVGRTYKREYMRTWYAKKRAVDKVKKVALLEQKFSALKNKIIKLKSEAIKLNCKHTFDKVDIHNRPWICKKCGFEY